jgi:hypothetical protein
MGSVARNSEGLTRGQLLPSTSLPADDDKDAENVDMTGILCLLCRKLGWELVMKDVNAHNLGRPNLIQKRIKIITTLYMKQTATDRNFETPG